MLTPRARHGYQASSGVNNDLYSIGRRRRCHSVISVEDGLHPEDEIGSSFLPQVCSNWFDEMLASRNNLYNSFLSALAAADALGSATAPSPKAPSFPADPSLSGTISTCRPVSRSPVSLMHRRTPRSLEQRKSPCFTGIAFLIFFSSHFRTWHFNISTTAAQTETVRYELLDFYCALVKKDFTYLKLR